DPREAAGAPGRDLLSIARDHPTNRTETQTLRRPEQPRRTANEAAQGLGGRCAQGFRGAKEAPCDSPRIESCLYQSSPIRICVELADLFEVGQFRSCQPKPYRPRGPRLTIDESARLERLDHLMHHRR